MLPSVPLLGRRLFSRSSTRRPRPRAILVSPISGSKRCLSLVLSLARSPPPPSFSLTLRFGQRRGSKKAARRSFTALAAAAAARPLLFSHVRHVGALHYARGLFRSFSDRPGPALSLSPSSPNLSFLPSFVGCHWEAPRPRPCGLGEASSLAPSSAGGDVCFTTRQDNS